MPYLARSKEKRKRHCRFGMLPCYTDSPLNGVGKALKKPPARYLATHPDGVYQGWPQGAGKYLVRGQASVLPSLHPSLHINHVGESHLLEQPRAHGSEIAKPASRDYLS